MEGGGRSGLEAEFLRGALVGLPAPEIDGELPGHGDDGFLAGDAGDRGDQPREGSRRSGHAAPHRGRPPSKGKGAPPRFFAISIPSDLFRISDFDIWIFSGKGDRRTDGRDGSGDRVKRETSRGQHELFPQRRATGRVEGGKLFRSGICMADRHEARRGASGALRFRRTTTIVAETLPKALAVC